MTPATKTRNLNVRLTADVYDALQRRAAEEDRTISSLTRRWLTAICDAESLVGTLHDARSYPGPVETRFDGGRL